jgi:predicted DsbA family dithiol-disulfide isomerase
MKIWQQKRNKPLWDHAYEEAQIRVVPTLIIGEKVLQGLYSRETLERTFAEEIMKQGDGTQKGMACGVYGCM